MGEVWSIIMDIYPSMCMHAYIFIYGSRLGVCVYIYIYIYIYNIGVCECVYIYTHTVCTSIWTFEFMAGESRFVSPKAMEVLSTAASSTPTGQYMHVCLDTIKKKNTQRSHTNTHTCIIFFAPSEYVWMYTYVNIYRYIHTHMYCIFIKVCKPHRSIHGMCALTPLFSHKFTCIPLT
jgi:hypothetical protein